MTELEEKGMCYALCYVLIALSKDYKEEGYSKSDSMTKAARFISCVIHEVADILGKKRIVKS